MADRRKPHDRWTARILRRHWRPPEGQDGPPDAEKTPWTVVTGGSEGLGPELARAFIDFNPATLLVARDAARLSEVARAIEHERLGKRPQVSVQWQNIDLTFDNAARRIATRVAEEGGYTDILILNAGVGLAGPFITQSPDDLEQMIALNVAAVTRCARHFLPGMVARGRGGIIMMGSLAGVAPGPHQAAYYASKAYVIALGEALAEEVAGTGVRVTVIAPGPVDTGFHRKMGTESALYLRLPGPISARRVANSARFGYSMGRRLVVPGLIPTLGAVTLRLLPHSLSVPLLARVLRTRSRKEP